MKPVKTEAKLYGDRNRVMVQKAERSLGVKVVQYGAL